MNLSDGVAGVDGGVTVITAVSLDGLPTARPRDYGTDGGIRPAAPV
jgi:hypothetical protein